MEPKINWNAESTAQSGSQSIAIHLSKAITQNPIKSPTKKIVTKHYKRDLLIKHAKTSKD